MNTHYLSKDVVSAYLRDLVARLGALPSPPDTILGVTSSGLPLMEELARLLQEPSSSVSWDTNTIRVCSIGKNTENNDLQLQEISQEEIQGRRCLLLDGAIHTGGLMNRCYQRLVDAGASEVMTYGLVVKRGSKHVPTFWGVMINDLDRALFLLDVIPNNRLLSGDPKKQKYINLSVLTEELCKQPKVKCKLDSLNRQTWGDYFYMMQTARPERQVCTYVLRCGSALAGYLSVNLYPRQRALEVDELAVDTVWERHGFGSALLRFAFTLARHNNCTKITLNAVEDKVGWYERFGFCRNSQIPPLEVDGEKYFKMNRSIVNAPESEDRLDEEA